MDKKKLADLRAKYGSAGASDVHDPEFKKVVDLLFSGDRRAKPYEGVSTFLDLPLMRGTEAPHAPWLAAAATPWPGAVRAWVSTDEDGGYAPNVILPRRAVMASRSVVKSRMTVRFSTRPLNSKAGVIRWEPSTLNGIQRQHAHPRKRSPL